MQKPFGTLFPKCCEFPILTAPTSRAHSSFGYLGIRFAFIEPFITESGNVRADRAEHSSRTDNNERNPIRTKEKKTTKSMESKEKSEKKHNTQKTP